MSKGVKGVEVLLVGLNAEQARAVKTTEGPLLILAGAGSGKTKTLTHRIAYILATNRATAHNILAVTFTNKAAGEMRHRITELLGGSHGNRNLLPFMGTFHAICVRVLRRDGEYIGVPRNFVIWDEVDRLAAIKQVARKLNIDEKKFPPRLLAALISGAKNEMVTAVEYADIAGSPAELTAAKVFPLYQDLLKENGALDFDDLIARAVGLLSAQKPIRDKWQQQFKYVMIDEYQDTNAAQYQLVKLLTGPHHNIAVVGDDWQSIYSWRGADYRNILNFENDYEDCTVIKLEQNYRSSKNILDAAHNVISHNKDRSQKKLWTPAPAGPPIQILQVSSERAEAEAIVRRIRTAVDGATHNFSDFAVLYRTNAQSRAIEEVFVQYSLPYRIVGGLRFYERKEIKDVMAYLRLIYQPDDSVSFERIVNVPSRGIGTKSLEVFANWRQREGFSLSEALAKVETCQLLTAKARQGLSELAEITTSFRGQIDKLTPEALTERLLRKLDYFRYLVDGTPQGEARVENVKELLNVAAQYHDSGLSGFLEEVALVSDLDTVNMKGSDKSSGARSEDRPNAVTLMTLHSAKGLEFPVVFITGLEETVLPHSRALYNVTELEEERRLMYVGMTRAKQELYLIHAVARGLYGGYVANPPSRFLADIKDSRIATAAGVLAFEDIDDVPGEPHYVLELAEGEAVRHQIFGEGTVLEVAGETATIYFKGKGTKKLNIAFAPLQKI